MAEYMAAGEGNWIKDGILLHKAKLQKYIQIVDYQTFDAQNRISGFEI